MIKKALMSAMLATSLFSASILIFANETEFITLSDGGDSSFSAVAASLDGAVYVFCAQSSLFGFGKLALSTNSGENLTPVKFELAEDRDLARIAVKEEVKDFCNINFSVLPDDKIRFASSEAQNGVSPKNFKIIAVGPSLFETSAENASENSGIPIFDDKNRLCGFCISLPPHADFSNETGRTILIQPRKQYAVKFSPAIKWAEVEAQKFLKTAFPVSKAKKSLPAYISAVNAWHCNPYGTLSLVESPPPELEKWIASHNDTVKNYPEYLAKIKTDRLPKSKGTPKVDGKEIKKFNSKDNDAEKNAALIQKLQKAIVDDAARLKTYPSAMAKSLEMQDAKFAHMKRLSESYSATYRSIESRISLRGKFIPYLDPVSFENNQ